MKTLSLISLLIVSLLLAGCGLQSPAERPSPVGTSPIEIVASPAPDPAADKTSARPGETSDLEVEPSTAAAKATALPREPLDLEIITILRKDGIPAILDPRFVSGSEGAKQMTGSERILGVSINGYHRAYPLNLLSRHEIVNDEVGGVPVAVTW